MNLIKQMMNSESNKKVNFGKPKIEKVCNCKECTNSKVENRTVKYSPLTEEEIEQIIRERYNYKDEKTKTFIRKALRVHGDRYDYSNVVYVKSKENVEIICRVEGHEPFLQSPSKHLLGHGCRVCGGSQKLTTEIFIKKSNEVHGEGSYDYSKVNYVNIYTEVIIICPKHGEFKQIPNNHLRGEGCFLCAVEQGKSFLRLTTKEFVENSNKIHGFGRYDYSKVEYINNYTEVTIICHNHEEPYEFTQAPTNHLSGEGCPICGIEKRAKTHKSTTEKFIERANVVQGYGSYNYSKVEYIGNHINVIIIFPKHGEFKQTPSAHLQGQGCPTCRESKGEQKIRLFLIERNIEFEREKRFNDCRNFFPLPFDFYLPQYNLCIEFDGVQHFVPCSFTHKSTKEERLENLKKVQIRDNIKNEYCEKNKIGLLRINNIKNVEKELTKYFQTHKIIK